MDHPLHLRTDNSWHFFLQQTRLHLLPHLHSFRSTVLRARSWFLVLFVLNFFFGTPPQMEREKSANHGVLFYLLGRYLLVFLLGNAWWVIAQRDLVRNRTRCLCGSCRDRRGTYRERPNMGPRLVPTGSEACGARRWYEVVLPLHSHAASAQQAYAPVNFEIAATAV